MSGVPKLELELKHRFATGFRLDVRVRSASPTVALFGPSGAGKSSVLHAIAGLLRPDEGRIAVAGGVLFDKAQRIDRPPRDRRVGLVPQRAALFPLMTVRENLEFGRPDRPTLVFEDVSSALEIGDLLERRPRRLSGGERQRVALGRAILREPAVLLLDEPFAALNLELRDRLLGVVSQWREKLDAVLVLVTHQPSEVEALAQTVVTAADGVLRSTP